MRPALGMPRRHRCHAGCSRRGRPGRRPAAGPVPPGRPRRGWTATAAARRAAGRSAASWPRINSAAPALAARRVHVLDAHQPAATLGPGVQPAGQRGHQRCRRAAARWARARSGRSAAPRSDRSAVPRSDRWAGPGSHRFGRQAQVAAPAGRGAWPGSPAAAATIAGPGPAAPCAAAAWRRCARRSRTGDAAAAHRCTRRDTRRPRRAGAARAPAARARSPQPRQRSSASILALHAGATVSTSCPGSRFTVSGDSAAPNRPPPPRGGPGSGRPTAARRPGPADGAAPSRRRTPPRPGASARCRGLRRRVHQRADGQVGLAARPAPPTVPASTSVRRRSRVPGACRRRGVRWA